MSYFPSPVISHHGMDCRRAWRSQSCWPLHPLFEGRRCQGRFSDIRLVLQHAIQYGAARLRRISNVLPSLLIHILSVSVFSLRIQSVQSWASYKRRKEGFVPFCKRCRDYTRNDGAFVLGWLFAKQKQQNSGLSTDVSDDESGKDCSAHWCCWDHLCLVEGGDREEISFLLENSFEDDEFGFLV